MKIYTAAVKKAHKRRIYSRESLVGQKIVRATPGKHDDPPIILIEGGRWIALEPDYEAYDNSEQEPCEVEVGRLAEAGVIAWEAAHAEWDAIREERNAQMAKDQKLADERLRLQELAEGRRLLTKYPELRGETYE